jgi:hypothetical protein
MQAQEPRKTGPLTLFLIIFLAFLAAILVSEFIRDFLHF